MQKRKNSLEINEVQKIQVIKNYWNLQYFYEIPKGKELKGYVRQKSFFKMLFAAVVNNALFYYYFKKLASLGFKYIKGINVNFIINKLTSDCIVTFIANKELNTKRPKTEKKLTKSW